MTKTNASIQKIFAELEEIASWFQRDDLDLDEALKNYQRGLALIKLAQTQLKKTENEFKIIKKSENLKG